MILIRCRPSQTQRQRGHWGCGEDAGPIQVKRRDTEKDTIHTTNLGCLFLHPKASSCTPCYFATVATATRSNINDSSATGEDHRGHRTVSSQDWLDDKQNSPNLFTRSIIPEKEDKFIKDITKSFSKETAPLFQYRIDKDLS